jgi:hypothetical protein
MMVWCSDGKTQYSEIEYSSTPILCSRRASEAFLNSLHQSFSTVVKPKDQ